MIHKCVICHPILITYEISIYLAEHCSEEYIIPDTQSQQHENKNKGHDQYKPDEAQSTKPDKSLSTTMFQLHLEEKGTTPHSSKGFLKMKEI